MPSHKLRKQSLLAMICLTMIISTGMPAWAIDCTKASDPIDKRICGNASLKAADAAMGQAYSALLKIAPDAEVRSMLVNSQRRWITARDEWFRSNPGKTPSPVSELRKAITDRTAGLADRSDKGFVSQAEAQRRLFTKYTGGAFSGFNTSCEFIPNDSEQTSFSYQCTGAIHVQNKDRVCSLSTEFATWSLYEYHAVSTIAGEQAKPVAFCGDQSGDVCENGKGGGWDLSPDADHFPTLKKDLPKLDAEASWPLDETDATWFDQCLTSPTYPPVQ